MAGMILHLVRHPPPDILPGRCYGRLDVPALAVAETAARLRRRLPPGLPVWSSPARRCRALAENLHPAPRFDERLLEMDFGAWEGQPWDAIPRAELDAWAANLADYAPPDGESARAVQRRALDFVNGLAEREAVLMTHAGVIRMLWASWKNLPETKWLALEVPYGEVLTIRGPLDFFKR